VTELLRERGAEDVLVLVGGIIPDEDVEPLKRAGVAAVYGPGTPSSEYIAFIREHVRRK